jgi:hypothetical protein
VVLGLPPVEEEEFGHGKKPLPECIVRQASIDSFEHPE